MILTLRTNMQHLCKIVFILGCLKISLAQTNQGLQCYECQDVQGSGSCSRGYQSYCPKEMNVCSINEVADTLLKSCDIKPAGTVLGCFGFEGVRMCYCDTDHCNKDFERAARNSNHSTTEVESNSNNIPAASTFLLLLMIHL
ncbi:uncharacterized protein LOC111711518 [Eurytemora carolleeae]|uniref:uncharacterized protein LOC111711518 n=1 Tax=Eurytemora carolleeae TaxID=1294199 RepID=UPI000C75BC46|nr:uncharacterized protein LOC111711518 [Eurytemora carolleeae]|eukprot:XP_023341663.1 uncharacterized protein LOC111711518 [Eurytemora affinis]